MTSEPPRNDRRHRRHPLVSADDQALIRAGFRGLIDIAPDLTVVGEAKDGQAALDLLRSERADVVLMDIGSAEVDGLARRRGDICADDDLAGVKVIVSTMFESTHVIEAAGGASGSREGVGPEELSMHRTVAAATRCSRPKRRRRCSPALRIVIVGLDERWKLRRTRREQMMALAADGPSNDVIDERADLFV